MGKLAAFGTAETLDCRSVRDGDRVSFRHNYDRIANSSPPAVNGLMIANGYTQRAVRTRRSLQSAQEVKLEFRTWEDVVDHTRRLHTGWLEVTRGETNASDEG